MSSVTHVATFAFAALLLLASSASAGIIVTEGDLAPGEAYTTQRTLDCLPIAGAPGDQIDGGEGAVVQEGAPDSSAPIGGVRDSSEAKTSKSKAPSQGPAISNLDETPEGFSCREVMPGVEMCEADRGQGAAAGAAGGGVGGDAVALGGDGPQAGCGGAGGPAGHFDLLLAMLALLTVALLPRVRRA